MELLLKKTIDKLGRIGDVITVKPGYARNFLLPLGYAVPVSKANREEIERAREQALAEERARVDSLKDLATQLGEASVTIEGRANAEGHLFGSVSSAQIAEALREKGFQVEAKAVRLDAPLKEIGVFDVQVHLHADVEASIKVWVVQAKPQ
ncbi:MAG: 50S ribosomal protein L9 [Planctomycetes bacterium]|nr:50S ribosomal protein L9 [Planctomycetota bacterium]